ALALAAPLGLAVAPAAAQAARSHGDASAEAFVQSEASKGIAILNDHSLSLAAKKAAFYGFVNQTADVPRITGFVLGRYRRQVSPAQYRQFAEVFRQYADSVYESRLGDYHGERLQVTGSLVHAPGDVVVSSVVTGGDFKGEPVVNWRVLQGPQGWKIVDVQAQGVWLAVVEQQDFTSTLANANGNIDVLIRQLRTQAAGGSARRN
uniref:MlaC/ttg2D family ABC transporter substrate-binding protein n=1 Tax=Caulobacter sp. S45 TaxID=1641861 RepID=UPI0015770FAA